MFNGYNELNKLPPSAFVRWQDFGTVFDVAGDEYDQGQYAKGFAIGQGASACGGAIDIRASGTWGADAPGYREGGPNAYISSYEGIGYHRSTAALLHGFLDSGARVVVHRWGQRSAGVQISPSLEARP